MLVSTLFDILFPGEKKLGTPSFLNCDRKEIINNFLNQIDNQTTLIISKINDSNIDPDELIAKIEAELPDAKKLLTSALTFYFSRPDVVLSLTGREVPLTANGMAVY